MKNANEFKLWIINNFLPSLKILQLIKQYIIDHHKINKLNNFIY